MNGFYFGYRDQRLKGCVHLRMSQEMIQVVREEAKKNGIDLSQYIRKSVEEKLEKKGDSIGTDSKMQEDCVCSGF